MRVRSGSRTGLTAWAMALTAVLTAALLAITSAPAGATTVDAVAPEVASAAAGPFTGVSPTRLLDTRTGTGGIKHALGARQFLTFRVAGSVVPAGSLAVVLNLTVTDPTASGTITAWAGGSARPSTSNLNFLKGQTVANLAVIPLTASGTVSLYNAGGGSVSLVADVAGYYRAAAGPGPGDLTPVSPRRLLDTRTGTGAPRSAVAHGGTVSLTVTGGAIPPGVPAVLLNVTATQPQAIGDITVYASGSARPVSSNLNFVKGQTVPNLVLAPVGADGKVELYNASAGSVQLVADVFGYFIATVPTTAGGLQVLAPSRILDTRHGNGATGPIPAHQSIRVQVAGAGGVPTAGAAAVVMNVTAASPVAGGNLTVYPNGAARPLASNINFLNTGSVPNLVMSKLGVGGAVQIYNASSKPLSVVADVAGFYLASALAPPPASVSRY
ncbi:MAG: hypothetical protein JWO63_595, partial [Frankiales bacterium]|nr:hypothetical protein [Frankiales bacterium]